MKNHKISTMVSNVFLVMESHDDRGHHIIISLVGAIATSILWWVHLKHHELFASRFIHGDFNKLWIVIVMAPPFVLTYGLGKLIFTGKANKPGDSGPMSGYLSSVESETKWKVIVGAGIVAFINWLLMLIATGPVQ